MPRFVPSEQLLSRLGAGMASSAELGQALGLSQSSVSRALRVLEVGGRLLRVGRRRGTRYGLRRAIPGIGSAWPLRLIDAAGTAIELGTLHALVATEYYFEPSARALEHGFSWGGLSEGLPYFLQDQRPGGFLGRAVPLRYPELQLPQRVNDWSDDHYLTYLVRRGSDIVGDLILGAEAFDDYLTLARRRTLVPAADRAAVYPQLVEQVMQGGLPGSSAHGEHPKFAAVLQEAAGPRQVLVKFSPVTTTMVGKRWSDLLIAEHLAHEMLRAGGIRSPGSRIFQFSGRTYLEVDRFDRVAPAGRSGVTSLLAIDTQLYGRLDNWIAASARLHHDGYIDGRTLERVRLIATFGALIANTDRHFGNLAFQDNYTGRFELASIYDMLPMLFAPEHDQVTPRVFVPPDPTSETLSAWPLARRLAELYWRRLAGDGRISEDFRAICTHCLQALETLPRMGAHG